ncbi:MAG TPA: hypothetical protein VNJ28_02640, partial [Candidatus Limnocylindrales bacterium]|nr:hypothetical protein [Candidatus Limnocylindrales bacterium]
MPPAGRPPTGRRSSRTTAPPDAAGAPRVRTFGGAAGYAIEWDVRNAYDFVFSLSGDAGSTEDLPAADRAWLSETRAALPASIERDRQALFGTELCLNIAALAVEEPDARDAAGFVAAVRAAGPVRTIRRIFFEDHVGDPARAADVDAALAGDPDARARVEAALPDWRRAERLEVLRDPHGHHERILRVLEAWAERFSAI